MALEALDLYSINPDVVRVARNAIGQHYKRYFGNKASLEVWEDGGLDMYGRIVPVVLMQTWCSTEEALSCLASVGFSGMKLVAAYADDHEESVVVP